MKTYKLTISYDGTAYHGWQEQPGLPTIEGLFKQRLAQIFKQEVPFTGASRTDTGVHALGQVARIQLDLPIGTEELHRILSNALPSDIQVRTLQHVEDSFHPRVNVAQKTYYYHFFQGQPSPFIARYGYAVKHIDLALLEKVLQTCVGTHDFRSFCTGEQGRTTVRTIDAIELEHLAKFDLYQIRITGPSFLRHMIRRIVGASFDLTATSKDPIGRLSAALKAADPDQQLFVAPPEGLLLHNIIYSTDQSQDRAA